MRQYGEIVRKMLGAPASRLVSSTGVGDDAELYAFMRQFPSAAEGPEISFADMSYAVSARLPLAVRDVIDSEAASPPPFATGSEPPEDALAAIGFEAPPAQLPPDLDLSGSPVTCSLSTAVRDQGRRGTCVAHAVAACLETSHGHSDLSEQFLYWGAKTRGRDPHPNAEGTWLWCARNALETEGVCAESFWPYAGTVIPNNETHAVPPHAPSAAAVSDAAARKQTVPTCDDLAHSMSGKASRLLSELRRGPVAISVPVFEDPLLADPQNPARKMTNWNWYGAVTHGHVLDPPQHTVVAGGHAVCVCGFHQSGSAPGGAWFVFKNSWGTNLWNPATAAPPAGHPRAPAGYGYLSAAYVDKYLWELLRA